ncbi:tRNA (adenosine(37)-N6)-threonylcarbamoyltransferase complex dimerization subunit type 1 TsaB [Anaeromassilibacillus senegalensis]|uniref:tRNA (adenosine(37)-N6)-threonylcarbamoyltransferase complex dimerization subunit type 1 TsaB n=1 Tax=Anaeromassilibacillus senegalensis TaxID=1673717 RepID=UPI0006810C08|nr:tRNA (adenosine(37)-N6)-threonylcarbamoyltransferase complex dimerization subunit type 1 TsaB [Anaeromassilibacillus senegalensis]
MKILAIDSSASAASAAIVEDGKILGECYTNTRLTHSQTLMPMVQGVLECARVPLESIDLFAVSAGPGSFTGVRIGVASVKGLAMAQEKPCAGVSTLEAMARNLAHLDGIICAVMDARCSQVYNALFEARNGKLNRLTEDRALAIAALAEELQEYGQKPVFLVGDGAKLCYNEEKIKALGAILPPEPLLYQRAWGVAEAAKDLFQRKETLTAAALAPVYLRLPQAERELKKRQAASARPESES